MIDYNNFIGFIILCHIRCTPYYTIPVLYSDLFNVYVHQVFSPKPNPHLIILENK